MMPVSSNMSAMLLLCAVLVAGAQAARIPAGQHLGGSLGGPSFKTSLAFLKQYMPETDKVLEAPYLHYNVELALMAHYERDWARAVPVDIFLNYVLPYANMDEPREGWRPMFHKALHPLVNTTTSITEAAMIINRDIWGMWNITFKADQTPEVMSPSQVIAAGYASCTGLSIFLVNALRAVGVPARVAGTPAWNRPAAQGAGEHPPPNHDYQNHNWVEVWEAGRWSYTGAAEYTPTGFNHTWFVPDPAQLAIPNDTMHAIYAVTFQPTPTSTYFPLIWSLNNMQVHAEDVTQTYLDASKLPATT